MWLFSNIDVKGDLNAKFALEYNVKEARDRSKNVKEEPNVSPSLKSSYKIAFKSVFSTIPIPIHLILS